MKGESKITVTFSLWDFGCLDGVLEWRIRETEKHMRVCGDSYTQESKENTKAFLAQMKGCVNAISTAREAFVAGRENTTKGRE